MSVSKAQLRFYRQSPRKVRLVANVIRGMRVLDARAQLASMNKRAAGAIIKLLDSAVANAENRSANSVSRENLVIETITVNQGPTLKRFMPRAQGRATPLRKRTSHISIVLAKRNGALRESGSNVVDEKNDGKSSAVDDKPKTDNENKEENKSKKTSDKK